MPHTKTSITPQESEKARKVYHELITSMKAKLKGDDKVVIDRAFELALDAHKYQRRKSGEAYIFHPIEVSKICHEEIGLGPTAIACALLHDVVEDTPVELEEIEDKFGAKIGKIVDGLTKLDGLYNVGNTNAENLKKVLSTLVYDVRVALIKMADRLHNLRTIDSMPRHKQVKVAAETEFIYVPLAHRLGLYKIKTEYEDIILKITDNNVYNSLVSQLISSEKERTKFFKTFIQPVEKKLTELDIKYRTQARIKAISSIYKKIQKKNVPLEKIYDLFAIRIIIDTERSKEKSICWHVYSVITDFYKPIPERLKDWVTTPKGNGYESLHTTVIGPNGRYVEVQIRTERMDDIAERGFAAHWKYKGHKDQKDVYGKWLDNIRTILENQDGDAIDFLNDFKSNLFNEEVYVFTPNGEMRILPKGATALDFAFDIHTDIGASASSIKVNGKLVPMGYKLNIGDQVTVNTSKNQKPTKDWLNMVVTGKARSKIRSSLNNEKKISAEIGKEILERKFKSLKIDLEDNIDFLMNHYNFKNRTDFFHAITEEMIKTSDLKKFEINNGKFSFSNPDKPSEAAETPRKKTSITKKGRTSKPLVIINDQENNEYDYQLATCCKPVIGDDIFAFLSTSSGLKIHRMNCKNASNLFTNYGYRILKADWENQVQKIFEVELEISGIDTGIGVLQNITNVISNKEGINILSLSIAGEKGFFEGKINLEVKNTDQLTKLIQKMQKINGINSVNRVVYSG